LVASPSVNLIIVSLIEYVLLILALAAVSISSGIMGAQFMETPRPRMDNPVTSFVNLFMCIVVGVIILLPLLPNGAHLLALPMIVSLPRFSLPIAVMISAMISFVITLLFYRVALQNAKQLLTKVQV